MAGLLLGPAVLGRAAPDVYQRVFVGSSPDLRAMAETIDRLRATGVTAAAINEKLAQQQRAVSDVQQRRLEQLHGLVTAIVLALAAVMVVESLVDAQSRQARSGLATARYALLAVWLALVLARPVMLRSIPVGFLLLLLIVALVAALVPIRRGVQP